MKAKECLRSNRVASDAGLAAPLTRAQYRNQLNNLDTGGKLGWGANPRYRQRTRKYGDYLYHQDREKFEADYQDELKHLSDQAANKE